MAFSGSQKPFLIEQKKPLMLKDYLLDDLSSCSSNGFKSFPRRQRCTTTTTTVRFLLEVDLKKSNIPQQPLLQQKRRLSRSSSKAAAASSSTAKISALKKASAAVINAVKLLPFPSSAQNRTAKGSLLPRRFSRKLFKKSFWKKADHADANEVKRWRSFRDFLEEKQEPSDQHPTSVAPTAVTPNGRIPTSSSGNIDSNSKNNSWTVSEFTGQSDNSSERHSSANDAVGGKKNLSNKSEVSEKVGAIDGQDSVSCSSTAIAKVWSNEEEKEQFSPVSVLDNPFQDDDEDEDEEEIGSPLHHNLALLGGNKQKPMQKLRRFGSLAQLEPVDLEKRIALTVELDDHEPVSSSMQAFPISIHKSNNMMSNEIQDENETEKVVEDLLKLVQAIAPSNRLLSKADNDLFLDFFREKIVENRTSGSMASKGHKVYEKELKEVQDWINGHSQEMVLGWEVEEGRHLYIIDMENNGEWRNVKEEKEDVTLELEMEIFGSLLDEALVISSN